MKELENELSYSFKDEEILNISLTHSSYAHERNIESNERIEYLGDAVLELMVSNYIYKKNPTLKEGELTKLRASIVCESSLAAMARKINLGKFIFLGRGEIQNKGYERDSILADTFEAVIGAVYLDSNYYEAERVFLAIIKKYLKNNKENKIYVDYKTYLQEYLQKLEDKDVVYELYKEEGPDHDKTFFINIVYGGEVLGKGKGKSKKEAEQNAAKYAIEKNNF